MSHDGGEICAWGRVVVGEVGEFGVCDGLWFVGVG